MLPILLAAGFASRDHFVMPFSDQWGLVPIVERAIEGELRFADLWKQKTDHRIFFPKLVMIPLAAWTRWNHDVEWKMNLVFAIGLFAVLAAIVRASFRRFDVNGAWAVWPALALLVFSPLQYKNWLWGLQIEIWMCALASCASLWALAARPGWGGLAAGASLAFVATHSFVVGLGCWPTGALLLAMADGPERRARLAAWAAASALAILSFALGFELHAGGLAAGARDPLGTLAYALACLGTPVTAFDPGLAVAAGALGVALAAGLSWWLMRRAPGRGSRPAALAGLAALAVYAMIAALAIGLGRAQFGVGQASDSRYVTWGSLLWAANAGLIGLVMALAGARARASLAVLCVLLGAGVASGFPAGLRDGAVLAGRVRESRDAVLAHYPRVTRPMLRPVTPRPDRALRLLPIVHRYRLSLFRER